jgi:hypothetical protein
MNDTKDVQLQRLFAREPLPAPDPALVARIIDRVSRQVRNTRAVNLVIALSVVLFAAALAPWVGTYMNDAIGAVQVATLRAPQVPLLGTALMALASIGAATWATRS